MVNLPEGVDFEDDVDLPTGVVGGRVNGIEVIDDLLACPVEVGNLGAVVVELELPAS